VPGRVLGREQVRLVEEVRHETPDRQVVLRRDLPHEVECLAAQLVVEDELRQREDEDVVEHARAGDRVHARERGQERAPESLGARLRVDQLRVGQPHVGLRREAECLANLHVREVEVQRLDRRHRRGGGLHVERGGRATEQHGSAGLDQLGHRHAGEDVRRVEHGRPHERDGGDQAHERDGDDLHRNACLDAVEEVLARVLAVAEAPGRGDGEDRQRPVHEVVAIAAEELHQLDHPRHAVLRERTRDHGLPGPGEAQVQAPGVGDLRRDVGGRERRRQVGDVLEPVGEPDVLDVVRGRREPRLAGAMVGHPQAARPRDEVHAVAADVRVRLAIAVVERERGGCPGDGVVHHVGREEDALALRVEAEARVEEARAEDLAADFHACLEEDALGLLDDARHEVVVENRDRGTHGDASLADDGATQSVR